MESNSNLFSGQDQTFAAETSSTFDFAPSFEKNKSEKKNGLTFHYNGCLIVAYYESLYNWIVVNPL